MTQAPPARDETPPLLVELRCPRCGKRAWGIDQEVRGAAEAERDLAFAQRTYTCPSCDLETPGFEPIQSSPPEFFVQPWPTHPMTQERFDHWVVILRSQFPDHPKLEELEVTWFPLEPPSPFFEGGFLSASFNRRLLPAVEPMTIQPGDPDGSYGHPIPIDSIPDEHAWLAAHFPGWMVLARRVTAAATGPSDCFLIARPGEARNVYFDINSFAGIEEKQAWIPPPPAGPPCPYCGKPIRTERARQCRSCGMDWHDPDNVVCRKSR